MIEDIEQLFLSYKNDMAYIIDGDSITYGELLNKSKIYAALLKKQGNSPTIIYGHKEINFIISIFSCILAKRAYIPVDIYTPLERLKEIVEDSKSTLILSDKEIDIKNIDVIKLKELNKYENIKEKENNNKYAYIIYTSGSTGKPKGVPITYDNLNNFISWISNYEPFKSFHRINVLNQASFSFDLSVMDIYYSLINGHTLVATNVDFMENYNYIYSLFLKHNINLAIMTPTFLNMLLLNNDFKHSNFSKLKCIYSCGEILENKTAKKLLINFPNIKLINAYGPTEATCAVSAIRIEEKTIQEESELPIGLISKSAVNIEIIDGEIVLKGKSVFTGYLNEKKITEKYYTGDIGYIKNDKLYFLYRKDNQIKYKGYRIELEEVEKRLKKIQGIENAVVTTLKSNEKIIAIKAFVIINKNINEKNIKENLKQSLPSYMIPIIEIVDKLPINKNYKIDRKALKNEN